MSGNIYSVSNGRMKHRGKHDSKNHNAESSSVCGSDSGQGRRIDADGKPNGIAKSYEHEITIWKNSLKMRQGWWGCGSAISPCFGPFPSCNGRSQNNTNEEGSQSFTVLWNLFPLNRFPPPHSPVLSWVFSLFSALCLNHYILFVSPFLITAWVFNISELIPSGM